MQPPTPFPNQLKEETMQDLNKQELDQVSGGAGREWFYCPYCGDDFTSEDERQAHVEAAHGIVTCPMCKHPMQKGDACEICGYAGTA